MLFPTHIALTLDDDDDGGLRIVLLETLELPPK